jgi:hypothetical protein
VPAIVDSWHCAFSQKLSRFVLLRIAMHADKTGQSLSAMFYLAAAVIALR